MTEPDKKASETGPNPVVTGAVGAVIGGATALAATALADEKNRQRLSELGHQAMDQVKNLAQEAQSKGEEVKDEAKAKVDQAKEKVQEAKKQK